MVSVENKQYKIFFREITDRARKAFSTHLNYWLMNRKKQYRDETLGFISRIDFGPSSMSLTELIFR